METAKRPGPVRRFFRGLGRTFAILIFIGIITITAVFSIFVFAYIGQLLHFPESIFNLTILIPLALTIYFSRFFLIFPAIAVDDKEMTIKNNKTSSRI